jgi:site-specific DNA-methyltransferase (adenine-specific)
MSEIQLIQGDCLDQLKTLDDNSIDSIVTDPPYGLGDNLYKRVNKTVRKSFNIMLPDFNESNAKRIQYSSFSFKSGLCPDLSRCESIPVIKSRVAMPEGSIHFDSDIEVRKIEIDRSTVSSSFPISNTVLMDKVDSNGCKFIGNFIFDFGDSIDFTADDVFSGNFGQFSNGFFSVPISSIFSSCFPNLGVDFPFPIFRNGILDIVWGSNDMGNDAVGHSFALTEDRAEDVPVLTFDMRGTSDNTIATVSTQKSDTFTNFIRPKLVRTSSAASGLSTMLQPVRVSFVLDTANGTSPEYFFHLYLPKNLLNSISNIYKNSSGFMGKSWDNSVPSAEIWAECLRVLKPGGHLLAFAGTRTQHRMAVNIEDAGFEIRNIIAWVYGSGFPKSQNVSKAIDKAAGAEREVVGIVDSRSKFDGRTRSSSAINTNWRKAEFRDDVRDLSKKELTVSTTDEAKQWDGWGTALKPALEPITVARKPLSGTVAANVLEHGTGAINIDGCRVPPNGDKLSGGHCSSGQQMSGGWERPWMKDPEAVAANAERSRASVEKSESLGRFPANLIHDGSDEVLSCFPKTEPSRKGKPRGSKTSGDGWGMTKTGSEYDDKGTAARFFYCTKASKRDRNEGLEDIDLKSSANKEHWFQRVCSKCGIFQRGDEVCQDEDNCPKEWINPPKKNNHPTVKPTDLMRYLVRLVTPPNGTVLDPFMGSGSTGKACMVEGFDFIGIELDEDYVEIARARIEAADPGNTLEDLMG